MFSFAPGAAAFRSAAGAFDAAPWSKPWACAWDPITMNAHGAERRISRINSAHSSAIFRPLFTAGRIMLNCAPPDAILIVVAEI
jgi:hypothetical protein